MHTSERSALSVSFRALVWAVASLVGSRIRDALFCAEEACHKTHGEANMIQSQCPECESSIQKQQNELSTGLQASPIEEAQMSDNSLELVKIFYHEKDLLESAWNCLIEQAIGSYNIEQKFIVLQAEQAKLIDDVKKTGTIKLLDKMIEDTNSILLDIEKKKYVPEDTKDNILTKNGNYRFKSLLLLFLFLLLSVPLNAYEVRIREDDMGTKTLYCYHYYQKRSPEGGYVKTSSLMDNLQHYEYTSEIGLEAEVFGQTCKPYVYFKSSDRASVSFGILILFRSGERKIFKITSSVKEGYFYKSQLVLTNDEIKKYFYNDVPVKMQVMFIDTKIAFSVNEIQQNAIRTVAQYLYRKE